MAMNHRKQAAHQLGNAGEDAAADWYRAAGYTVVARNWRCFEGEIDIIAIKGRTIVVCEVKSRANDRFMDPALSVSASKQAKVRTAAYRWLQETKPKGRVRFDVALVVNGRVRVIEGAF